MLTLCMFVAGQATAKVVDFIEDGYLMPASPEIVTLTENAAQLFEFEQPYEVAMPKKSGLQINPWNRFIASGIHPQTKNPLLVINDSWFKTLDSDQQMFLLGRTFLMLQHGGLQPFSVTLVSYLLILLSLGLLFLLFWLLGKTQRIENKWARMAVAYGIFLVCNITFLNTMQAKVIQYFGIRHDIQIIQMTVEKTHNKQAAIKALEAIDSIIKDDLRNGEQFWEPHATLFENYANGLK